MIKPFEELFGVPKISSVINDYKKNVEETPKKCDLIDGVME